jgi:hypothetical protein
MNTRPHTGTPCSLRLPQPLRERVRERAKLERRSFANTVRVLLERQLDAPARFEDVDPDEIERLALVAQEALADYAIGGRQHA